MSSDDTFAAGLELSAAWIGRNFSVKLKIEVISIFYHHLNGGSPQYLKLPKKISEPPLLYVKSFLKKHVLCSKSGN